MIPGVKPLPPRVRPYRRTPDFTETTVPAPLRARHTTKPGVWGLIRITEGRLRYRILEPSEELVLTPDHPGVIEPEVPHEVELLGSVRFHVEFLRCEDGD